MIRTASVAAALFAGGFMLASPALANSTDEVRRAFDRFVAAQNAHDLDGVASLLADGPGFMWVTRGTVVKGRAAAISRFRDLYRGTWRLRLDAPAETFAVDRDTVQLVAPVTFMIGPPGAAPTETRFIFTQLWHRRQHDWQVVTILPIPVSVPSSPRP